MQVSLITHKKWSTKLMHAHYLEALPKDSLFMRARENFFTIGKSERSYMSKLNMIIILEKVFAPIFNLPVRIAVSIFKDDMGTYKAVCKNIY